MLEGGVEPKFDGFISTRVVISLPFNPSKPLITPYLQGLVFVVACNITHIYNYSDIFHFSAAGTFVKSQWRSAVFLLLQLSPKFSCLAVKPRKFFTLIIVLSKVSRTV